MPPSSNGFHPFNGRLSRHLENLNPLSGAAAEDPYLSYHDVLLTHEDVDTLRHNDWLTDNVISFWEEYLEHEVLAQAKHRDTHVVLLRPSMSFLLVQTADPVTLKDALPNFDRASHVFLPITDNHDVTRAEGGSHWSLLLVSVHDGVAFHYDSLASANQADARRVTSKLSTLLGQRLAFHDLQDTPQQENGSDCGVFVCAIMKFLLLHRLLKTQRSKKGNMSMGGHDVHADASRREMVKVIEGFRREGVRRRS